PLILLRAGPPRVVSRLDTDPDSSGNSFRSRHTRPRSDSKTAASVIAPCDSVNGVVYEEMGAGCWGSPLSPFRPFALFRRRPGARGWVLGLPPRTPAFLSPRCHGFDLLVVGPALERLDDPILHQRRHPLLHGYPEQLGHCGPCVDQAFDLSAC